MKAKLVIVVLSVLMAPSPSVFAKDGHCTTAETTVFSCDAGKKAVSVCASDAGVQYRYGSVGATEMKYPATKPTLYDGIAYQGSLAFSGGGAQYVRFINNDHEYVVYSGQGRGWEQDGLLVVKAGKVISHKTCEDAPEVNFSALDSQGIESDGDDVASEVWELVPIR